MDESLKKKRRLKFHSTVLFTIYIIFLLIVTIVALVSFYNGGYYLAKLVQDKLIHRVVMSRGVPLTFKTIYTVHDVRAYILDVFLPSISGETGPKERAVRPLWRESLYMTEDIVIVGVPRIRTHKVRKVKCNILRDLQVVFEDCYGPYQESMENRNSEGISADMFRYRTEKELHGTSHAGRLATYSGGGSVLELNNSREVATETLLSALNRGFVEPGTRTIIMEMSVFSRSLQLYAMIRLLYERTPGGGVVASYKITLITTKNGADIALLFFLVIYIGVLIYDIALRREDLIRFKFWALLDVAILLGLLSYFIQGIYLITNRIDIPLMIRDRTDFVNFAQVAYLTDSVHNIHAIIMFLLWMRLFRFLECSFTMLSIQNTFSQASAELLAFSLIFIMAFGAFAIMASLLFGSQLEDYRTPFYAFAALMRAIVGDYDYEEIDRLEPVMASIFLFFFILIIILSFLNFFLAILMDAYTRIRKEQTFTPQGPKDKHSHLEHLWAKIRGAPKVECWRGALLKANFPPKAVKQILERNELNPCGPIQLPKLTKIIEYERLNYKLDVDIIKMRNHIEQLNMRMVFLGYAAEEMSRNTDILCVNFKRVLHDNFDEISSSEEEIDKAMDKSMKQFANLKDKKSFSRKSSEVGPNKIPLNCGPSCFITQYQTSYEVHPLTKAAMMRAGRSSEHRQATSLSEYPKKTIKADLIAKSGKSSGNQKKVHRYFMGKHFGSKTQTSTDGNIAAKVKEEKSTTQS